MYYTGQELPAQIRPGKSAAGEWYLKGFEDAHQAHAPVVPWGPAGQEYSRGYTEGLADVQRDFFAAISNWSDTLQVPQMAG